MFKIKKQQTSPEMLIYMLSEKGDTKRGKLLNSNCKHSLNLCVTHMHICTRTIANSCVGRLIQKVEEILLHS